MLAALESFRWGKTGRPIDAEIGYLRQQPPPIDSWVFLAPQIEESTAKEPWIVGHERFSCVGRTRESSTRFGTFSSPEHADFAKWLVGGSDRRFESDLQPSERTGILLFYPTRELKEKKAASGTPVMGFALVLPSQLVPGGLRKVWVVKTRDSVS
jgi:hypothetical protein